MANPLSATTRDNGLRYYRFNEHELLSVTSMRKVIGMPFSLAQWQVNQVVEAAIGSGFYLTSQTTHPDDLRKSLKRAATLKRDEAAALGTAVHDAAEEGIKASSLPKDDPRRGYLIAYERWHQDMQPRILLQEAQVFNLSLGYAGSLDCIADMPTTGKRTLIDFKTGKGVYTDHIVQAHLYWGAEFVGGYDAVTDSDIEFPAATQILKGVDELALLHLHDDGTYEYIRVPLSGEVIRAANGMIALAQFFIKHPNVSNLILEGATA